MARGGRPPVWAILGTIAFVCVVPGTVVVAVPWWISGWRLGPPLLGTNLMRVAGLLLVVAASPLFAAFVARFVVEGHGTPAPIVPTRHLVVGGPFRWTRNPGYIAVVAMLVGQGLVLGSVGVLVYAALVAVAFHLFVVFYEEPTLRRTFGADFEDYCRRVPRWVPRRPRAE